HNDGWFPLVHRLFTIDTINQQIIRKRKIKYIEAFGGEGRVISDFVFDLYRGWFEDSAGKVSLTVVNATEGGGRIRNTVEETLASVARRLPEKSPLPQQLLERILARRGGIDLSVLAGAMGNTIERLDDILLRAQREPDRIEEIADSIEGSDLSLLFAPVLRRTTLYLVRKRVEPDKGLPILLSEIQKAAKKLRSLFLRSLQMMNRGTP
ncbi:MAG: motility associated factor glycosyltransferase family protein, partial [Spirochaetes bacterium]|nr:motility associated factor glycosyltransferase family protein [Spirochaetota bacterium]